jgi:hypothetical protein
MFYEFTAPCELQYIQHIFKWMKQHSFYLTHVISHALQPFEIPCSNSTASSLVVHREEMTTITLSFNIERTHNQTHNRKANQQSQEHANLQYGSYALLIQTWTH